VLRGKGIAGACLRLGQSPQRLMARHDSVARLRPGKPACSALPTVLTRSWAVTRSHSVALSPRTVVYVHSVPHCDTGSWQWQREGLQVGDQAAAVPHSLRLRRILGPSTVTARASAWQAARAPPWRDARPHCQWPGPPASEPLTAGLQISDRRPQCLRLTQRWWGLILSWSQWQPQGLAVWAPPGVPAAGLCGLLPGQPAAWVAAGGRRRTGRRRAAGGPAGRRANLSGCWAGTAATGSLL